MKIIRCLFAAVLMALAFPVATTAQVVIKGDSATVAQWIERANNGEAAAQNKVGLWYYTGVGGLEKNYETAVKYWALAAKQDHPDAIGNMAMCYQLGNGVEVDSTMAAKLYINAIQKGNTKLLQQHERLAAKGKTFSVMLLYDIFNNGKAGQQRDQAKALNYLEKAAEADNTQAQTTLAITYINSKRPEEAVKWFKALADKDVPMGNYYYGMMLYQGMGIAKNIPLSIGYLEKAAAQDFTNANRLLGQIYYSEGAYKDVKKAVGYLKKAAKAKNAEAQLLLGRCYVGGEGATSDYDVAAYWLGEAFVNKNVADKVTAFVNDNQLFKTYLQGLKAFCDKDYDKAAKRFEEVGKAGRPEGLIMQIRCKAAVKKTAKKAFKEMEKAAETSLMAKYLLVAMYEQGIGTKADKAKADQLFSEVQNDPSWDMPYDPKEFPTNMLEWLKTL